jgi:hypothetical protein
LAVVRVHGLRLAAVEEEVERDLHGSLVLGARGAGGSAPLAGGCR